MTKRGTPRPSPRGDTVLDDDGRNNRADRPAPRLAFLPWTLLAACLAITVLAWQDQKRDDEHVLTVRFEREVERIRGAVLGRFRAYESILRSSRGFVIGSERVTADEWRRFYEILDIDSYFPEIHDLTLTVYVTAAELAAFEAAERSEVPGFEVFPKGRRDHYLVVRLAEPRELMATNVGFDMGIDPVRREAAERARDTGRLAMSADVPTVAIEGQKSAILLFLPIYRSEGTPATVAERRAALVGWVNVGFHSAPLIDRILAEVMPAVQVDVFDAAEATPEHLIYDPDGAVDRAGNEVPASLERLTRLHIGGRTWTLHITVPAESDLIDRGLGHYGILISGLILSFFLWYVAHLLVSGRQRAIGLAGEMTAALHESEGKYRRIFEHADDGIFQTTLDGRFISANPAMARMLGYDSPKDLMASVTDIGRQLYVDPEGRERLKADLLEHGYVRGGEDRWRRKDGRVFWYAENTRLVRNADGEILYLEGMVRDISERKRAEEALNRAKEEAELANRAKTDFLANMSHELRTPLNSVIGFSDMLKSECFGPLGDPRYREYAEDINESGCHLLAVISDILDVSKIEAGVMEVSEENVLVGAAVESCVRMVNERAEKGRVALSVKVSDDLPVLRADSRQVKQILLNLLSNAIKFTPAGGGIAISAGVGDSREVVLRVSDSGIGIAAGKIPRVLEPFGQAGDILTRNHEGTGLGLSLAKSLIELHGGTLTLESELERGTTVTVRFPPERSIAD